MRLTVRLATPEEAGFAGLPQINTARSWGSVATGPEHLEALVRQALRRPGTTTRARIAADPRRRVPSARICRPHHGRAGRAATLVGTRLASDPLPSDDRHHLGTGSAGADPLGLKLRLAESQVPPAAAGLGREIGRIACEFDGAIDELRNLAWDPPVDPQRRRCRPGAAHARMPVGGARADRSVVRRTLPTGSTHADPPAFNHHARAPRRDRLATQRRVSATKARTGDSRDPERS